MNEYLSLFSNLKINPEEKCDYQKSDKYYEDLEKYEEYPDDESDDNSSDDGYYIIDESLKELTAKNSDILLKSILASKGILGKSLTNRYSKEKHCVSKVLSMLSTIDGITIVSGDNYKDSFNYHLNIHEKNSKWNDTENELEITLHKTSKIPSKGSRRPDLAFYYNDFPEIMIILEFKLFHKKGNLYSFYHNGSVIVKSNYNQYIDSSIKQISSMAETILKVSQSESKQHQIINYLVLCCKDTNYENLPRAITNFGMEIYRIGNNNEKTKL